MQRRARNPSSSVSERQEELEQARQEMQERHPELSFAQWRGGYPPMASGAQQREIPELDTNPHSRSGHSATAPPHPASWAGSAELHTREEQPPASNPNVPANPPRVVPPEAPPSDATTEDLPTRRRPSVCRSANPVPRRAAERFPARMHASHSLRARARDPETSNADR